MPWQVRALREVPSSFLLQSVPFNLRLAFISSLETQWQLVGMILQYTFTMIILGIPTSCPWVSKDGFIYPECQRLFKHGFQCQSSHYPVYSDTCSSLLMALNVSANSYHFSILLLARNILWYPGQAQPVPGWMMCQSIHVRHVKI